MESKIELLESLVIIYDNITKMNQYEIIHSLFVNINNNFKTRVVS